MMQRQEFRLYTMTIETSGHVLQVQLHGVGPEIDQEECQPPPHIVFLSSCSPVLLLSPNLPTPLDPWEASGSWDSVRNREAFTIEGLPHFSLCV